MEKRYEIIRKVNALMEHSMSFADTLKEAYEMIADYEKYDKLIDNYKPNNYKIIDRQFNIVLE